MALRLRFSSRTFSALTGAQRRCLTTVPETTGIRDRLMAGVKSAMKSKDSFTSVTLRSVLSEVYAADKSSPDKIPPSAVIAIIRKAALRRYDAAAQFNTAARPDLAEKETKEADLLSTFLPPLMSESDIDRVLREVIDSLEPQDNPKKYLGQVYRSFYLKVDKSVVDADLVKQRAEALVLTS